MDSTPSGYEGLARRFLRYADHEYRNASPLYEHLARSIASDADLLALAAHVSPEQPTPNLFFAAIHFLLLQGQTHLLAQFYPSLTSAPQAPQHAYPALQDFCRTYADAIRHQLTTRINQTNEVSRCAYLMPAFTLISSLANARPLALVEIGTSAGLNLMRDHYGYDYGSGVVCGNPQSPVQLTCALRGDHRPPLPEQMPAVGLKIGLDLNVIDIRDADEALWLRALVWPENRQRAALLSHAIDVAREHPPQLQSGDGLSLLPDILQDIPQDMALCVFHTHVLNQFSPEARDRLATLLETHAATRDVYRLSAEWLSGDEPQLELTAWQHGELHQWRLAYCHHHGQWLEWLDFGDALG
ncbi:DUF2332 domain-containing protein [Candidatus Entotheonella palauensis]|uniref:DUF2332 domain-containing protein n=1 Tax=Candidatus Entotheonella palauensis TaxID=93172 RepID=UPI000B7D8590|nr:DUF2332 domain-containing protein [Candidatus Entotheonella palauensis]